MLPNIFKDTQQDSQATVHQSMSHQPMSQQPMSHQPKSDEINHKPTNQWSKKVQSIGIAFIDVVHYIVLFLIGFVVVWASAHEFWLIVQKGYAALKDILMLFIYLELLAMIGIYFKTHRLPVQFLIFIAITALSRHLVVDVQAVSDTFHLWLLATISISIFILSLAIVVLTWTAKQYGRPEDNVSPEALRAKS